jgi:cytochrome c oxidase subunit III
MVVDISSSTVAAGPGRTTGQLGVIVFLASDIMLFAPFFAAYFLLRSTNDPWPSAGVELDTLRAAIATIVLIASSGTAVLADRAHEADDRRRACGWLFATIGLGLVFLVNQLTEYTTLDFRASDDAYGSIYWGLTGLHTAHVAAGIIALGLLVVRVLRAPVLHESTPWARGISTFWHLVDIVWVAVFITIWVIR